MSKLGIANLLAITGVMASIGNIAGKSYEDGKLSAADLPGALIDGAAIIPSLISIEWNQLIPEGKDLDQEEQAQLMAHYKAKFDIPQDDLELTIEDVIEDIRLAVMVINRMVKRFKKQPVTVASVEEIPEVIAHS